MNFISNENAVNLESHECESHETESHIIYFCTKCDYEMHKDLKNGRIKVLNMDPKIRHFGTHKSNNAKQNSIIH